MGRDTMMEALYVCAYVPEFAAQALMRLRPELAACSVVVMQGEAPLEEVCSCNFAAGKRGIVQGMSRAELDGFQDLRILGRSNAEERSARAALLTAAAAFTPRIEIRSLPGNAFIAVLDMTGSSRLFGSTKQCVSRIARALKDLCFHVQLAAACNFHTAVCAAQSARRKHVILTAGEEAHYLSQLPLAYLNLNAQQVETLALWGLRTFGELAALPEVELVTRLGQEGRRLRLLARGEHVHLMVPEEAVFTLEEFLGFDAPIELLDTLLFVFGPMLDQLLTRAQNHALALASVTVKLGLDGGGEHERTIKPALPVAQREVLLKLLHLDLQAHPPAAGVVSVLMHAEPGDRSKVQLGLFAPQLPEAMRLDVTLARIASLVGEDRIGKAKLADTHRPNSFTMERFTVPTYRTEEGAHACKPATAALRRCRPPVRVIVQHEGDQLNGFFLHGKRYVVQEAYGPWRKSGDWWESNVWSFEEWDVRANTESDILLCLLSHDLLHHQWQMVALYD